jgi:hypothetical protein
MAWGCGGAADDDGNRSGASMKPSVRGRGRWVRDLVVGGGEVCARFGGGCEILLYKFNFL